jgi:putative ABC transport system ATP-binding protein
MTGEKPWVIDVQNAKRYYETVAGTVKALDDVSLQVASGEFLAVAGPSGSGKSTLLNLVGALDTPTAGSICVDGQLLASLKESQLAAIRRDRIGFVFQAYNLIQVLSVRENVEYVMELQKKPAALRKEKSMAILNAVGLGDKLDRKPTELSGGQQQRVAVARAVVAEPAIVLADEPTANLDSRTGDELLDMMQKLNKDFGTTFLFSTHDPQVMERATRLVRLHDGQIESDERR